MNKLDNQNNSLTEIEKKRLVKEALEKYLESIGYQNFNEVYQNQTLNVEKTPDERISDLENIFQEEGYNSLDEASKNTIYTKIVEEEKTQIKKNREEYEETKDFFTQIRRAEKSEIEQINNFDKKLFEYYIELFTKIIYEENSNLNEIKEKIEKIINDRFVFKTVNKGMKSHILNNSITLCIKNEKADLVRDYSGEKSKIYERQFEEAFFERDYENTFLKLIFAQLNKQEIDIHFAWDEMMAEIEREQNVPKENRGRIGNLVVKFCEEKNGLKKSPDFKEFFKEYLKNNSQVKEIKEKVQTDVENIVEKPKKTRKTNKKV